MSSKIKYLNNDEMALFCDQMAMILKAGITPHEGLMDMLEDTESKEGKELIQIMLDKCELGASFYDSVLESNVFPKYALDMIKIGEKSGNLEEVMRSLAFHYRREENIKQGIKNAVTYPFIIVLMMLAVILVLVVKVLPIFNKVFIQLGTQMTGFSNAMLHVGTTISNYSTLLVGIVILFIGIYLYMTVIPNGIALRIKLFSKMKLTRGIYDKIAAGRFAAGMSLSMYAGLDMDEGMEMMEELVDNPEFAKKVKKCRELSASGYTFSDSLAIAEVFPSKYSRIVSVGYKTGSTENALEKVATIYEEEVDNKMSSIISFLEPTLVIVLSIIVCLILLSVMLPLMAIMTGIG